MGRYSTNSVDVIAERHTVDEDNRPTNLNAIVQLLQEWDRLVCQSGVTCVDNEVVDPGCWIVLREDDNTLYAIETNEDFEANYTEETP